ncbi:MAG: carotenoid biosynthesis protein [Flavobacteriales bacterium]
MKQSLSIENKWIGLLLLFYFFGLLGMCLPQFRAYFLPLTPLNLLLTLVIFYKVNNNFTGKFLLLSVLVFLIGFSVEAIGVNTGLLFGNYEYGDPFGFKLFETPVMIGVNWLFLALSTFGIVQHFTNKAIWLIAIPPLLMVGLDVLVEPIAIKLDFWSWQNNVIPAQNYIMWYITSLAIHALIYFFGTRVNTKVSFWIFGVQFVFFGVLNLVL